MNQTSIRKHTIAILGATGYIGLILTRHLAGKGHHLRLFVRNKTRITYLKGSEQYFLSDTPLIEENLEIITRELQGVDVIYYLIHSMKKNVKNFSQTDNQIAAVVSEAASRANVKQVIYVGGLGKTDDTHKLSKHLQSRQTTAVYLKQSGIPLTEFRTGIVCGEGSASFEMIRTLSTKLPFIPVIPFNNGACQIIDINDLIAYLDRALNHPDYLDKIIELGTEHAYSYNELITIYARIVKHRNLKIINLPLLKYIFTESVISVLISWFTRIPIALSKPLIAGMKSLAVVDKYPIEKIEHNSAISCRTYEESIINASSYRDQIAFESYWKVPFDIQYYIQQAKKAPLFSQYIRNGLFFSTLVHEVDSRDKTVLFDHAKQLILKNKLAYSGSGQFFLNALNTLFHREKLHSIASFTTLTEGSISKEWRVAAISESRDHSFVTLSSQFKGTGFLWFQVSVFEDVYQRTFLMLRLFFEPISIPGHLYWHLAKHLHQAKLQNIHNTLLNGKPSKDLSHYNVP